MSADMARRIVAIEERVAVIERIIGAAAFAERISTVEETVALLVLANQKKIAPKPEKPA